MSLPPEPAAVVVPPLRRPADAGPLLEEEKDCLQSKRSSVRLCHPWKQRWCATLHVGPRSCPAPDAMPHRSDRPSGADRTGCDKPRWLPPSGPKTTTAAAQTREEPEHEDRGPGSETEGHAFSSN